MLNEKYSDFFIVSFRFVLSDLKLCQFCVSRSNSSKFSSKPKYVGQCLQPKIKFQRNITNQFKLSRFSIEFSADFLSKSKPRLTFYVIRAQKHLKRLEFVSGLGIWSNKNCMNFFFATKQLNSRTWATNQSSMKLIILVQPAVSFWNKWISHWLITPLDRSHIVVVVENWNVVFCLASNNWTPKIGCIGVVVLNNVGVDFDLSVFFVVQN